MTHLLGSGHWAKANDLLAQLILSDLCVGIERWETSPNQFSSTRFARLLRLIEYHLTLLALAR